MIESPPLLRIARNRRRPSDAQISAFRDMPTSFVADAMGGVGSLSPGIRPLGESRDIDCRAAGPALTVENAPGDLKGLLAALNLVEPGHVVVSAFHGHQGCAAAGDRVSWMLKMQGAVGFVTDGPMRDYPGLVGVGLPSWCTGLNPASPATTGPGTIGLPIQIGGQRVETGDMIVADFDGVVVVPFARIDAVAEAVARVAEVENALDEELRRTGELPQDVRDLMNHADLGWVD